ncbi:MAG: ribosome biogenesis/translation initiation ATPase RLI [Candidatus Diapherotrites archaeon CG11_big_fil_rev_8_21_14_0_20_37_9]|nr:MAG: ribosome biogenesis/translation initiation ATPase RLI [Candidatus Diapherotrites archaeon CG11_big_fil_rev_8_21_14_0_20_37_9]
MVRIAVVEKDRCINEIGCDFICGKVCPVNRTGKECISLDEKQRPVVSEDLCIGCNLCVIKCPVDCVYIENLVQELSENPVHRYGENEFRFYRIPVVKKGEIVGLIGRNGIGKSSIVKIISGHIIPNLGDYKGEASYDTVIKFFKGKEQQNFFTALRDSVLKVSYKPQNITDIPKAFKGKVKDLLLKVGSGNNIEKIASELSLGKILSREISTLSGGELQRVAIAAAALKEADIYTFDEPTSYLDIRERLKMARLMRELAESGKGVVVIEHDLAVLDYLSDYVHLLYGKKSVYGITSNPKSVRNGINEFLDGYVKDENVRFRKKELKFEVKPSSDYKKKRVLGTYPDLKKKLGSFSLEVKGGDLRAAEVLGIMGPNGIGKTTFVRLLAGAEKPDSGEIDFSFNVSYKPQYLDPEKGVLVSDFLASQDYDVSIFKNEIDRRLAITELENHRLDELSGGELQKVAVGLALARESDLVLLDEPTAFVDIEDRLNMADAIRSVIDIKNKICMCVDHDILFQDYVSDRLIIFDGEPAVKGIANAAVSMHDGMNAFLGDMGITFRRDPQTGRPRANKAGSQLDQQQKKKGEYYYSMQ